MAEGATEARRRRRSRVLPYVPAATVVAAFAVLLLGPTPVPASRLVAVGALAAAAAVASAQWGSAVEKRARDSTRDALYRTAAGDLTLGRKELDRSGDPELANALHGLLVEMERILASFARLAGAVSGVARELTTRGRDLSQAVVLQNARAEETAAAIEKTDTAVGSLRASMEQLAGAAENAGASLHQMTAAIGEVSQSAQGLRAFVDETTRALEGMLAALDDVAGSVENLSRLAGETARAAAGIREATLETDRQTKTAARLAERVSGAAAAGKTAVSGTVEGMDAIRESVGGASGAASTLGERSARIGEVLRVIEEIAGETNLLALNASIIAAQAGESGRAFSVVAEDIRDLSDRTALSTEEVRGLVSAVRDGVDEVQRLLRDARQRADQGVDLAKTSDDALSDIERLAGESKKASEGIAAAAAQQTLDVARVSEASARVSEEVARISGATRGQVETARGVGMRAERVKQSAEQLSRAMTEQATGSRTLLDSMERVTSTVDAIAEATATLADGSASVVRSMEGIRRGTAQNAYAATAMNLTAQALEQEALMLKERASVFRLPAPAPGGRVRAALRYVNVEDFDPAFATTIPLSVLAKTWGEGLVTFAEGTRVLPELAERWEVDPTGTLFTFSIRRGVLFHEGGILTSAEVKASFERYLSPALDAPLAVVFDSITGWADYRAGKAPTLTGV
ncbi:MAG TPA: methyl-accepting chemotaxis protein, partial [Thermoanaerobaculia bacterium]|nr:methyl-accepting chemotaxis protein [Thermoanaerobaculia bacterium]